MPRILHADTSESIQVSPVHTGQKILSFFTPVLSSSETKHQSTITQTQAIVRYSASKQSARLQSGDHGTLVPPGSIPNPEVKRRCADGSGAIGPVRVGRCQNLYPPFPFTGRRWVFLCGDSEARVMMEVMWMMANRWAGGGR